MANVSAPPPSCCCNCRRWLLLAGVVVAFIAIWAYVRFTRDEPVTFASDEDHFKYGSTGGERDAGIPYWVWKALPELFPEFLPDGSKGLGSLGFVFDPSVRFRRGGM